MLLKIRTLLNLSSRLFVWDFLTYPRCQRLFMRGFRFRSSLKKWPARKASGPERHPFDSAEPITTPLIPKHPESGCSADWFLGDVECFKCSDWITITIGAWWGRGWFEADEDQIPNNPSTRHVRFRFLKGNWKYQMSLRTEDLDKAIAEHSIRCGGNKCESKRGHCKLYARNISIGEHRHCCLTFKI